MSILEDAGYRIPRPGWPGRRRAQVRAIAHVVAMTAIAILLIVSFSGLVLLAWAATLPAPR